MIISQLPLKVVTKAMAYLFYVWVFHKIFYLGHLHTGVAAGIDA